MINRLSLLLFICLALIRCSSNEQQHTNENHDNHAHHENLDHDEPSDMSIYNLNSIWIDQLEDTIALNDLQGHPVVLALIYTYCEFVCPRIVADIQVIEDAMMLDKNVKYVLVTIDPERDDPARLNEFAEERGLETANWVLLNGNNNDILELAAVLGVRYKKTTGTDFTHSNIISILNEKGEIVHQQIGLGADPKETIRMLHAL